MGDIYLPDTHGGTPSVIKVGGICYEYQEIIPREDQKETHCWNEVSDEYDACEECCDPEKFCSYTWVVTYNCNDDTWGDVTLGSSFCLEDCTEMEWSFEFYDEGNQECTYEKVVCTETTCEEEEDCSGGSAPTVPSAPSGCPCVPSSSSSSASQSSSSGSQSSSSGSQSSSSASGDDDRFI